MPNDRPRAARPRRPNARHVALDVLDAVFAPRPRPAEEVFHNHKGLKALDVRDRAFARILYTTVLRKLGEIDRLWRAHVKYRPHEPRVINVLRLGTAQLIHLSTPPHAAVSETVALATGPFRKHAGLINAVLRRVGQEGRTMLEDLDQAGLNTPKWLMESWADAYGKDVARRIAEANGHEPPLDLSPKRDGLIWATAVGGDLLANGTIRRREGSVVDALPGYGEGAWWVQDAAASLPVLCLGDIKRKRVLDIGAAPGGKTAQLIARGAEVTAIERSPARAEILSRNLARLDMDAEIVTEDATRWQPDALFDAVLLDAPCTATGTIRRHPDVLWTKSPKDVTRLGQAQAAMLEAAASFLQPGGTLIYATCSLQPEEGEQQIETFLEAHPEITIEPIAEAETMGIPVVRAARGTIRTFPYLMADLGGLDGFFIARLRKTAS